MSEWTDEKHHEARQAAGEVAVRRGGGACEDVADYLDDALDEIERLRGLADDPTAVDVLAREICEAARLPGVWDMTDEFDRESFREEARRILRAVLNPEVGEQA